MTKFYQAFKNFVKEEEGATLIEYALLAALISVVAIGAMTLVGDNVKGTFDDVAAKLSGA